MIYRELLDSIQLMAELEPSYLNKEVLIVLADWNEYHKITSFKISEEGNQYIEPKSPVLVSEEEQYIHDED